MKKDDKAAEREAIEHIIYTAYSIILDELLSQPLGETAATAWLNLTARGMKRDSGDLARSIQDFNQRILTRKPTVTED